jgi:hypothetical protein
MPIDTSQSVPVELENPSQQSFHADQGGGSPHEAQGEALQARRGINSFCLCSAQAGPFEKNSRLVDEKTGTLHR